MAIMIVAVILYILIFYQLVKRKQKVGELHEGSQHQIAKLNRETKQYMKMMVLVLAPIIIVWVPFNVMWYTIPKYKATTDNTIIILNFLFLHMMQGNSFINPLIYAWCNSRYRRSYIQLLTCGRANVTTEGSV